MTEQTAPLELANFTTWLDAIDTMRHGANGYKDYVKLRLGDKETAAKATYEAWLEDPSAWNGSALPAKGSEAHEIAKNALNFTGNIMGNPFRSAFYAWVHEDPDAVQSLLSPEAIASKDYDLLRADLLKAFGEALLDRDPETGKARRVSPMFESEKNNTYLTKTSTGEWVSIDEDTLAKMVRDPNGPRLMVTATHAFFESMKDMTPLPEMYENVAKTAAPDIRFVPIDHKPTKGDTLMVCTTNTRENNFLNLEDLFRRLHDISEHMETPEQDDFRHASNMTTQMNALILKAIAADETEMHRVEKLFSVDGKLQPTDPSGKPLLFSATAEDPLRLSADAPETIRKIAFVGFSKAGNAFRDGSRLIQHQLMAKDEAGNPLVDGDSEAVLRNLSVTGGSFNEKAMSDWYIVPQAMISNRDDKIAPPRPFPSTDEDVAYHYLGGASHADHGHTFKIKFEGVKRSEDLLDYYSTLLAPNTGRAAIAHVRYKKDTHALQLTTGQTTDHALFESKIREFEDTLRKKGLDVSIQSNGAKDSKRYEIRGNNDFELFTPRNLQKLQREFESLDADSTYGIFVSRAVTEYELPALRAAVTKVNWQGAGEIPEDTGKPYSTHLRNIGNGFVPNEGHPRINQASSNQTGRA